MVARRYQAMGCNRVDKEERTSHSSERAVDSEHLDKVVDMVSSVPAGILYCLTTASAAAAEHCC